jgi:carbon starvation protein
VLTSVVFVAAWGWFLYQGVIDPLGGINTLWPVFGIANQLLAVISLALGTTVLIKMGRARYIWVTLLPMLFLLVVTMTAGWQKIMSADAAGFAPAIAQMRAQLAAPGADVARLRTLIFNNQVDIVVTAVFMVLVCLIVLANAHLWLRIMFGKSSALHEEAAISLDDPNIRSSAEAGLSH